MNDLSDKVTYCRVCGSTSLEPFLDLGSSPLADDFVSNPRELQTKYPLRLGYCLDCGFVSLLDIVSRSSVFHDKYGFFTGSSPSAVQHFRRYAEETKIFAYDGINDGLIVDVACNDGTLLDQYQKTGLKSTLVGVDPCQNVVDKARERHSNIYQDFFDRRVASEIKTEYGKAKLITANNVLAHVSDICSFIEGISCLLDDEGTFIFEVHYLKNLIFNAQFDNVYHEHLSFFSIKTLQRLFNSYRLNLNHVQMVDTQGGSIRCFVNKRKDDSNSNIDRLIDLENKQGLSEFSSLFESYQQRVDNIRDCLIELVQSNIDSKIYAYGASAKSTTLLNYCELRHPTIEYIVDKTPSKIGKYTPGTLIPIIDDNYASNGVPEPDLYLLTVWNYLSSVMKREKRFIDLGGKFIVPLPNPMVI